MTSIPAAATFSSAARSSDVLVDFRPKTSGDGHDLHGKAEYATRVYQRNKRISGLPVSRPVTRSPIAKTNQRHHAEGRRIQTIGFTKSSMTSIAAAATALPQSKALPAIVRSGLLAGALDITAACT